jgi:[ribosomal protein S5]-alanine N-acetyltransferase
MGVSFGGSRNKSCLSKSNCYLAFFIKMRSRIPISDSLALTPFQPEDRASLVRWLQDPEVHRNTLRIPHPYTASDADGWMTHVAQLTEIYEGIPSQWAIRHTEWGHLGNIGMFWHGGATSHFDEIGYWIGAPFRGMGLTTLAVQGLVKEMFDQRPALVRIHAIVFAYNLASVRVLEKAGFEREGYHRNLYLKDGHLVDGIMLARLRHTYNCASPRILQSSKSD